MRGGLGAWIDRRMAVLVVVRLRRTWPVLRLVPVPWILPVVTPGARRLRRGLARGAIGVTAVGAAIALLAFIALAV